MQKEEKTLRSSERPACAFCPFGSQVNLADALLFHYQSLDFMRTMIFTRFRLRVNNLLINYESDENWYHLEGAYFHYVLLFWKECSGNSMDLP